MSTRGVRAGRAFVEVGGDTVKLERALRRAQQRLRAFGSAVQRIGTRMATIATAAFAPISIASIKAASDAEESLSRFAQVFGQEAQAAGAFADELAKRIGRSSIQIKDALGTFQSFFVGMGYGASEARALSQQLTEMALDFASFNNLSDDEGIGRFISALSGSSEVLDRFGINIKQAALQQELLRMGITKSWSAVTEQEKAMARLGIIMRTMGDQGAAGDATRTADSFANRLKRLQGELRDLAVAIGQALLPVVTPLVAIVTRGVGIFREWAQNNPRLVATIIGAGAAVAGLGIVLMATGAASLLLSAGIGAALGALAFLKVALLAIATPTAALIAAVVALGMVIARTTSWGGASLRWLMDRFGELRAYVGMVVGGIFDAFASGNLDLAFRIMWLGAEVAFHTGTNTLLNIFEGFVHKVYSMWVDLGNKILNSDWWDNVRVAVGLDRQQIRPAAGERDTSAADARAIALEQAQRELAEAIEQAKAGRGRSRDIELPGMPKPVGADFDFADTSARVVGTFNARAAQGLAGSPTEDRIAKATEETAKGIKQLNNRASAGGLVLTP